MTADDALAASEYDELMDRAVDALLVLARASLGDHEARIPVRGSGPLSALFGGLNDLLTAISAEHEQSALFRRELNEKLAVVERQRAAIREMSTPIIEVWEGVLCMPIVGVMDTVRTAEITDALLQAIATRETRFAIIDITGIQVMDTSTVGHLIRLATAVRMLGAECFLTGLAPHIAQTVVHMGVDLDQIVTHRSLRDALHRCVTLSAGIPR
jgi:rsbT co-antagonist protein RsbR